MESRIFKPVLAVYVGLFLLFLYGPFIVLGILSFQQGPPSGPCWNESMPSTMKGP